MKNWGNIRSWRSQAAAASALPLFLALQFAGQARGDVTGNEAGKEAKKAFKVGIDLYEEEDFEGALVKFERAYALSSNWRILYNIGQASWMTKKYCRALDAFKEYIKLGGNKIDEKRRDEVYNYLEQLDERTSGLKVEVSPGGALVKIDGVEAGRSPLPSPICLDLGAHDVDISLDGYEKHTGLLQIEGKEEEVLEVVLKPEAAGPSAAGEEPSSSFEGKGGETAPARKKAWYKKWWLWTGVGVVLVGAAAGTALGVAKPFERDPGASKEYRLP